VTVHQLTPPDTKNRIANGLSDAEDVAFEHLQDTAAILYAKARRYAVAYEADSDGIGDIADGLRTAAEINGLALDDYFEAYKANMAAHPA
jgi:hypothetical protein